MRVVIAGASGFLGTHLTEHLRVGGHEVTHLVRREPERPRESRWDPYAGSSTRRSSTRADVVVNLAGARLAGNPHSQAGRATCSRAGSRPPGVLAAPSRRAERPPALLASNGIALVRRPRRRRADRGLRQPR